uniref:Uncharacterized protein n=1 Tax=Oryza brachyantha TaxID=4533 RepID=J3N2M3_ORYBR
MEGTILLHPWFGGSKEIEGEITAAMWSYVCPEAAAVVEGIRGSSLPASNMKKSSRSNALNPLAPGDGEALVREDAGVSHSVLHADKQEALARLVTDEELIALHDQVVGEGGATAAVVIDVEEGEAIAEVGADHLAGADVGDARPDMSRALACENNTMYRCSSSRVHVDASVRADARALGRHADPGRHDVVIKPVGEASGRKELDEFGGPYREAVSVLSKRRREQSPAACRRRRPHPARLPLPSLVHRRLPQPLPPPCDRAPATALPPPSALASATARRLRPSRQASTARCQPQARRTEEKRER